MIKEERKKETYFLGHYTNQIHFLHTMIAEINSRYFINKVIKKEIIQMKKKSSSTYFCFFFI